MMGLRATCCADGGGFGLGQRTATPQDGVESAFTHRDAEQVVHLRGTAFVTQVLRLFVIHHGGFQARPKAARRFQAGGRRTALYGVTVGAFDFVSLRFNHERAYDWQFRQLMTDDALRRAVLQIRVAIGTTFGFDFNDAIRFFYQRTRRDDVAGFGTDPFRPFGRDQIGLLIARRRLRGVAGSNRWRSGRQFRFQFQHPLFQRRALGKQDFHQRDQFGTRELLKLCITDNHRIQRPCGSVKINLLRQR